MLRFMFENDCRKIKKDGDFAVVLIELRRKHVLMSVLVLMLVLHIGSLKRDRDYKEIFQHLSDFACRMAALISRNICSLEF